MKVIIEDLDNNVYNINLTKEQIKFAHWLVNNDILCDVKIIDEIDWEDIK